MSWFKVIGFKVVRKFKIKKIDIAFSNIYCTFCPQILERKYVTLFSVSTSVCREDPLLSGNCLLSTMVTTCFQSSQSCGLRNLRHLKMPLKKITPNRHERVGLNMKMGDVLSVCLNEMPRMGRAKMVQPIQKLWRTQCPPQSCREWCLLLFCSSALEFKTVVKKDKGQKRWRGLQRLAA